MQLQPHPIEAERGKKRNGSGKRGGETNGGYKSTTGAQGRSKSEFVKARSTSGGGVEGKGERGRRQPFIIRQNAKRARHFNRNRFSPRKKVRI